MNDLPAIEENVFNLNGIRVEYLMVDKELIYSLRLGVENGLEYAKMCLSGHDRDFGRTIKKNRIWAETIERDIEQMQNTLTILGENFQ